MRKLVCRWGEDWEVERLKEVEEVKEVKEVKDLEMRGGGCDTEDLGGRV
jgi:hypothetical protein